MKMILVVETTGKDDARAVHDLKGVVYMNVQRIKGVRLHELPEGERGEAILAAINATPIIGVAEN